MTLPQRKNLLCHLGRHRWERPTQAQLIALGWRQVNVIYICERCGRLT